MEKGVFLEADVDKHGLEALLDVFHAPLVDGADDVAVRDALDVVFFELSVLEHGHAFLEFLGVDNEAGAAARFGGKAQEFFDFFDHDGGCLWFSGVPRIIGSRPRRGDARAFPRAVC